MLAGPDGLTPFIFSQKEFYANYANWREGKDLTAAIVSIVAGRKAGTPKAGCKPALRPFYQRRQGKEAPAPVPRLPKLWVILSRSALVNSATGRLGQKQ